MASGISQEIRVHKMDPRQDWVVTNYPSQQILDIYVDFKTAWILNFYLERTTCILHVIKFIGEVLSHELSLQKLFP